MSTVPTGLGYAGGRSGHFSTSNNHAFRGSSALSNTFGGGVAGTPTPGMYSGLAYPGGRSGNFSGMENHAFRGTGLSGGLGAAVSSNMFLTGLGLLGAVVVLEAFRTRRAITGIKPIDETLKEVAKVTAPITKPAKKVAEDIPLVREVAGLMGDIVPGR